MFKPFICFGVVLGLIFLFQNCQGLRVVQPHQSFANKPPQKGPAMKLDSTNELQCIGVNNANQISMQACNTSLESDQWQLIKLFDGNMQIRSLKNGQCLDTRDFGSLHPRITTCRHNWSTQFWHLEIIRNDIVMIRSRYFDKCLESNGPNHSSLRMLDCNENWTSQRLQLQNERDLNAPVRSLAGMGN